MAVENRDPTYYLDNDLSARAHELDFYQVVRRLECQHPGKPRVGDSVHPREDFVHFCQNASLGFAPSSIASCKKDEERQQWQLWVNFMGLLGPHGPMPLYLTEYVRDRTRNFRDMTLECFLNLFNHRMISLFYKAWAVCQKPVSFDRPENDQFGRHIACLAGLSQSVYCDNDVVEDNAKLYYSGRFLGVARSREGLESIVRDYFQVPARLAEYTGQWVDIPKDNLLNLDRRCESAYLGRTTVIGSRVWECQHTFRLVLGPLTLRQFERFLPGQKNIFRLASWVRNYVGSEFKWDVQLILSAPEIPRTFLGRFGQLGYTTWIGGKPHSADASQLVLTSHHLQ